MLTINHLHPFLALNSPVKADILVVEGWLPDYAIKTSIDEFKTGGYRKLITTGGPLSKGYYLAEYKTFAEIAAATLIALNFEPDNLIAVPAPAAIKHRTQASAVALRQWLSTSGLEVKAINLYTFGPHARRSWLIFKQVLAPEICVGVIAAQPLDYDANNWWQSSTGVRSTISESIAYAYARFIDWKA
ncbi:MAG: YdcF family protein [Microcoleus vaginatus WJT46-NPBG5]|nr:YdcF family protein [Microcoleus vaginatus WJT46-NPBG5]